MLGKVKGAVEHEDHFSIDDGSGRPFRVAKSALSPHLVERVRKLYCGGKVQGFADGGLVDDPLLSGDDEEVPPGIAAPLTPTPAPTQPASIVPDLAAEYRAQQADPARRLKTREEIEAERATAPPATGGAGFLEALVAPIVAQGAGAIGTVPIPPPGGMAPEAAGEVAPAAPTAAPAPGLPPPGTLSEEARAAGIEAAKRIAEAGEAAKRSLEERTAAAAQARAAEYNAAAGLVRAQDEATQRAEEEAARLRDVYQRGENALRLQKEKLAQREKELLDPEAMRIETRRVFSKTDPVGLIIGAMMVGAAEAGLRKGSGTEAALKVIGDAIDRDVLAQRSEKESLRSARFRAYEAAVGDANNAAQLLKADQQLIASTQARLESQRTQSAQGRAMLAKLSSDLAEQARKTAEDAVQLMTGQAIAQQKAAGDAESRQIALRQGEAALARGAAELAASGRAEARADDQLALARERLELERREVTSRELTQAATARVAAAKAASVDYDALGKMGYGLPPEAFAQIKDDKAAASYIIDEDDQGRTIYRRARNEKAAEKVGEAQMAAQIATTQLEKIEKYIPAPGKKVPSTMGFGEEARRSQAEIESATQALVTQLKEIERLGALTNADLGLVKPRVPTAQGWFSTDVAERQQASDLRESIDAMVDAIKAASVAPLVKTRKTEKGSR